MSRKKGQARRARKNEVKVAKLERAFARRVKDDSVLHPPAERPASLFVRLAAFTGVR